MILCEVKYCRVMHRLEEMEVMDQMAPTEMMERRVVQEVVMVIIPAVLGQNLHLVVMVEQEEQVRLAFQGALPIAAHHLLILAQMVLEEMVVVEVQAVKEVDFQEEAVVLMALLVGEAPRLDKTQALVQLVDRVIQAGMGQTGVMGQMELMEAMEPMGL